METTKNNSIQRRSAGFGTWLFFIAVVLLLYQGWQWRDQHFISAEFGLGYWLGIIGGSMMLLLLVYPLRKRNPSLSFLGGIKPWFQIHMMLGLMGPTAILYHCNFDLGALNSNVALFCMLIVSASGLLGRYFYSKIHHGLYGQRATLHELQSAAQWGLGELMEQLPFLPELEQRLQSYETRALAASHGIFSFIKLPWLNVSSTFAYKGAWRFCRHGIEQSIEEKAQRRQLQRQTKRQLQRYFDTVVQVAELEFYRKLFSLWHVLHLPLFIMMLITGVIHIVAVHMY